MLNYLLFIQSTPNDQKGELDLNPQSIIEKLDTWLDGFVKAIPNILIGVMPTVQVRKIIIKWNAFNTKYNRQSRHLVNSSP